MGEVGWVKGKELCRKKNKKLACMLIILKLQPKNIKINQFDFFD